MLDFILSRGVKHGQPLHDMFPTLGRPPLKFRICLPMLKVMMGPKGLFLSVNQKECHLTMLIADKPRRTCWDLEHLHIGMHYTWALPVFITSKFNAMFAPASPINSRY